VEDRRIKDSDLGKQKGVESERGVEEEEGFIILIRGRRDHEEKEGSLRLRSHALKGLDRKADGILPEI